MNPRIPLKWRGQEKDEELVKKTKEKWPMSCFLKNQENIVVTLMKRKSVLRKRNWSRKDWSCNLNLETPAGIQMQTDERATKEHAWADHLGVNLCCDIEKDVH